MMKKILAVTSLALMVAVSAHAGTHTNTTAGTEFEITSAGGTSATFTYQPSPGVVVDTAITDATYIIITLNTATTVDNQNAYGVFSGKNGYYQFNTTTADTHGITLTDTDTTDLTDPFGDWDYMGGGS